MISLIAMFRQTSSPPGPTVLHTVEALASVFSFSPNIDLSSLIFVDFIVDVYYVNHLS